MDDAKIELLDGRSVGTVMHRHPELPKAFAELGVETPFLHALHEMGFSEPTEIQARLVPLILAGRDVLGQAKTGTGKTAAFGLPVLQLIRPERGLQALVLVPTRELAVQVAAELRRLGDGTSLRIVPVYGGQRIRHQLHLLGKRPHLVVGTPGRVIDLLERGAMGFQEIRFAVLDEVDRMLDIGFRDDIRHILGRIQTEHQTVFVSATISDEINRLARTFTTDPVEVNVSRDTLTVEEVAQAYMTVEPWDKFRLLQLILQREDVRLAIVFCNTKHAVRRLAKRLHGAGIDAKEIHGDLVQDKRERVMDRFRKHKLRVLVATDLAARGIDVHNISHIINYDIPDDAEVYVHRIGRTARMGSFGRAITFVTREQGKQLTEIEKLINRQIPEEQVEGFVPRPPRDDYDGPDSAPLVVGTAGEAPSLGVGPLPAAPAKPKGLGAKFKPARRRRRL